MHWKVPVLWTIKFSDEVIFVHAFLFLAERVSPTWWVLSRKRNPIRITFNFSLVKKQCFI